MYRDWAGEERIAAPASVAVAPEIEGLTLNTYATSVGTNIIATGVIADGTGIPAPSVAWQWQVEIAGPAWEDVPGEDTDEFMPDSEGTFRVGLTLTNAAGSDQAYSDPVTVGLAEAVFDPDVFEPGVFEGV